MVYIIILIKNINSLNIIEKIVKLQHSRGNRKKTGFTTPYEYYLNLQSKKQEFNNPLRDWSTFSLKNI